MNEVDGRLSLFVLPHAKRFALFGMQLDGVVDE